MKDELVSFETAKLAKEKGFDIPTLFFYLTNHNAGERYILVNYLGAGQLGTIDRPENHNNPDYYLPRISVPTLYLLQRWLREVHGINIDIHFGSRQNAPKCFGYYHGEIHGPNGGGLISTINYNKGDFYPLTDLTYEQALELALQIALKLIKT